MKIGIVGAGEVGSTLAELFLRADHEVTLCHRGAYEDLRHLVARLGPRAHAATAGEAARYGDLVVIAIPFGHYWELPRAPFAQRNVVDATNYFPERDGEIAALDVLTSSELLDRHLGEARIVKAFNTLPMRTLRERARPRSDSDRIALPLSTDYRDAKRLVGALIHQLGFDPVDLGGLAEGGQLQQPGGPLFVKPLTVEQMRQVLGLGEQPRAW
jgi:predicted dinucleotide-binding enzyme